MDLLSVPLNFEMAATDEMQRLHCVTSRMRCASCPKSARNAPPKAGWKSPARKTGWRISLRHCVSAGCRVSIFIAADIRQIEAAHRIGAQVIELHSGAYCDAHHEGRFGDRDRELDAMREMAHLRIRWGWRCMWVMA